jgi:hypothetical protein
MVAVESLSALQPEERRMLREILDGAPVSVEVDQLKVIDLDDAGMARRVVTPLSSELVVGAIVAGFGNAQFGVLTVSSDPARRADLSLVPCLTFE